MTADRILCHICSKQELWSQRNSPLLANGSEKHSFKGKGRQTDNGTTSVTRQQILNKQKLTAAARERLGKHVPAATDTHATIDVPFETGFSSVVRAEDLLGREMGNLDSSLWESEEKSR
jgi:hypothetical protein